MAKHKPTWNGSLCVARVNVCSKMDQAFCAGYLDRLSKGSSHPNIYDVNRYKEKVKLCGVDPYELLLKDCADGVNLWTKFSELERNDYFICRTNFATKDQMKALKSFDGHNFLTSGLVFRPLLKEVSPGLVLVLGKVMHSQSHSLDPLKVWILAKMDGEIITGHCTCMAGRGEACSHFAAVVFPLEFAATAQADVVATDLLNWWLPPSMAKNVPKRKVSDMDFSSPTGRLVKLGRTTDPEGRQETPNFITQAKPMTQTAIKSLYAAIAKVKPHAVVLSALQDHHQPFIPPEISDDLPKLMSALYDESCEQSYGELLVKCRSEIRDIVAREEQVNKVECLTRKQAASDMWFKFRQGRITASNMKLVCRGDVTNPARSTINKICYGSQKIYSQDIERGRRLEKPARMKYASIQGMSHQDFTIKECGLYLFPEKAYLAASPDGIVSCSCCESPGGLEIKCPRDENMDACFDGNGSLLKNHQYYYQVQAQMFVCNLKYCDFFVYNKKRHNLHRVAPDQDCHTEIVEKSQLYFLNVILPEIISKHFSRNQPPITPRDTSNICYCQRPRRDPMVHCSGKKCTFVEFHCRCVDLMSAPKNKKWYCDGCKKTK